MGKWNSIESFYEIPKQEYKDWIVTLDLDSNWNKCHNGHFAGENKPLLCIVHNCSGETN